MALTAVVATILVSHALFFTPSSSLKLFFGGYSNTHHLYLHEASAIGPSKFNVSGPLRILDPLDGFTGDGCNVSSSLSDSMTDFFENSIILVSRGNCTFVRKIINAQNLGASGVIVGNDLKDAQTYGDGLLAMQAGPQSQEMVKLITIPSIFITAHDFENILANLTGDPSHNADSLYSSRRLQSSSSSITINGTSTNVFAMLDKEGQMIPEIYQNLQFLGWLLLVIPSIWCCLVSLIMVRRGITNGYAKMKRKRHLSSLPVISFQGTLASSQTELVSIITDEEGDSGNDENDNPGGIKNAMGSIFSKNKLKSNLHKNGKMMAKKGNTSDYARLANEKPGMMMKDDENDDETLVKRDDEGTDNEGHQEPAKPTNETPSLVSRFKTWVNYRRNESSKRAPLNETCAVCLDDFAWGIAVKILPCSHGFHSPCIDQWLTLKEFCPMCKRSMFETA